MMFEDLKKYFENFTVTANTLYEDGRINSINDEESILVLIKTNPPKGYTVLNAPPRYWYDFALVNNTEFYPINIKSTSGHSADNISSKEGMYYALTGRDPKKDKITTFENFNKKIIEYYKEDITADYFFLVFLKNQGSLFFTSLKRLETIVSNGNNLPFQCKWENNLNYTERSCPEQSKYILNTYIDSFMKRTPGLDYLLNWREANELKN